MQLNFSGRAKAIALAGVLAASVAFGQGDAARDMRVKLFLKDADMIAATRSLTQQTGLQFVVKPTDKPYGRITLKLDDVKPEEALAYICQAAGAYFTRDESGVFVISHEKPQVEAPAAPVAAPVKQGKTFRRIHLLHADPADVYRQIAYAQISDPYAKLHDLNRFKNLPLLKGDNSGGNAWNNIQPRAYSPQIITANPTSLNGPSPIEESGNDVRLPGEEANQRGGIGGGGGGGLGGQGGGIGGGGIGGGGQGGLGGGQGGQVTLTGGTGLVPDTIDFISYDPTDNSLIVRGTSEEDINELQNTIASFDIAPRQVIIRVEFITTQETLDKSLGYNIQYQRGPLITGENPAEFLRASDPVFLTYATGNAVLRLRARLAEGTGKLVTAPIIRTLNNVPASVSSFVTQYIVTSQTVITNGIANTNVNPIPITAGTSLTVAPRINDDGYITLALSPQVGGIIGTQSVTNLGDLPIISQQQISCIARVKNRETIVLGGLNTENIVFNQNRVPILSEIPIIGQFFRQSRTTKNNSELLVFVTPEIVEDDPGGFNNP